MNRPELAVAASYSSHHDRIQAWSGVLMLGAVVAAMALANSPLARFYDALLTTPAAISVGDAVLKKPILLWINEGLMAAFFLLVALEIKHEMLGGALSRLSDVALPGVAAIGGIALPAALYALLNVGDGERLRGWAIPTTTDIAFSVAALRVLGARVPRSLQTFLMTVAVFDDIGAIAIIAVFYAADVSWVMHGLAALASLALIVLNRSGVTRLGPYLVLGALLWVLVLKSGVHATLAGVVLGFTIPYRARDSLGHRPSEWLEHALHPYVALGVLPLFAFANAGLDLGGIGGGTLVDSVTIGIAVGLVVGKMLGVWGAAATMVRLGLASMPAGVDGRSLLGAGALAGIGFTMSLFLGTLAFEAAGESFLAQVRLGVLGGSTLAAIVGIVLLRRSAAIAA